MRNKPLLAVACLAAVAVLAFVLLQFGDEPAPGDAGVAAGSHAAPVTATAGTSDAALTANARTAAPATATNATPASVARAPSPAELWGRVVDAATHAPVAGADVELQRCDADEFWNLDLAHAADVTSLARTKTDGDGRFRFDVERALQHRLRVSSAGYAPATVMRCAGGGDVLIELSRGAAIDGVVRLDGRGVPDVDVRIELCGELVELARARTDGGGAFRVTGLAPAAVWVQIASPRFETDWRRVDLRSGEVHRVEIDLARGQTLHGRVVEATTGTPIVDAEVAESWLFRRVARTDTAGRFTLAGLKNEAFCVCHVRAVGYASASQDVAGRFGQEVEFRLVRGGEVAGRVVDGSGAPRADAYVAIGATHKDATGREESDWIAPAVGRDGRFHALGLRPDRHYWLLARARGCGSRAHALARMLGSGEQLDVGDVVVRAAGGIEGRVTDDGGASMRGLEVRIRGTNGDSRAWLAADVTIEPVIQFEERRSYTDGSGAFRFAGVAAGRYEVRLRPPGSYEAIVKTVDVTDGAVSEGVDFVVPKGLTIAGSIAYSDGHVVGDELADVQLQATTADGANDYTARIDAGGAFRIENLPAGEYTLALFSSPAGWVMAPRRGVRAGAVDLRLLLERPVSVAGRVVDGDGKGVRASVWTRAEGIDVTSASRSTDDDGRFRLDVPPGFRGSVFAASAVAPGKEAETAGVVAGQTDIVITLKSR